MLRKKFSSKKKKILVILSSLIVLVIFSQISIQLIQGKSPLTPLGKIIILWPKPEDEVNPNSPYAAKSNLQLRTFPYIVVPPPPSNIPINPNNPSIPPPQKGPACADPSIVAPGSTCHCDDILSLACPKPPPCIVGGPYAQHDGDVEKDPLNMGQDFPGYCIDIANARIFNEFGSPHELGNGFPPAGCMAFCIAKPVVYLYPTKTTDVSVSVVAPGTVVVSDPHYPEGGWKNVLAHPDGTLIYNNKKYSELFYETSVTKEISQPEKGIVMAATDIESTLRKTTTQFGLNAFEQKEFLEYWVPTLQALDSPYIFFSILDPEVKESIDKLVISPEPTTRIELIAYFKPLQKPISVSPLTLPSEPPTRIGFTEVEWGGTIAN